MFTGTDKPRKDKAYELFVREFYETLLAQSNIPGIAVQHNVSIRGKSGADHQIDVYWEFELVGIRYRTCVECKYHNRKLTKSIIASFARIVQDIPDATGIMVTTHGYQPGATLIAQEDGVRLLVLQADSAQLDAQRRGSASLLAFALIDLIGAEASASHPGTIGSIWTASIAPSGELMVRTEPVVTVEATPTPSLQIGFVTLTLTILVVAGLFLWRIGQPPPPLVPPNSDNSSSLIVLDKPSTHSAPAEIPLSHAPSPTFSSEPKPPSGATFAQGSPDQYRGVHIQRTLGPGMRALSGDCVAVSDVSTVYIEVLSLDSEVDPRWKIQYSTSHIADLRGPTLWFALLNLSMTNSRNAELEVEPDTRLCFRIKGPAGDNLQATHAVNCFSSTIPAMSAHGCTVGTDMGGSGRRGWRLNIGIL